MILYDRFWMNMKKKKISQYKLINYYELSNSLVHRLKNNRPITTTTLNKLCMLFNCEPNDIISYTPDEFYGTNLTYGSFVASEEEYQPKKKKK